MFLCKTVFTHILCVLVVFSLYSRILKALLENLTKGEGCPLANGSVGVVTACWRIVLKD